MDLLHLKVLFDETLQIQRGRSFEGLCETVSNTVRPSEAFHWLIDAPQSSYSIQTEHYRERRYLCTVEQPEPMQYSQVRRCFPSSLIFLSHAVFVYYAGKRPGLLEISQLLINIWILLHHMQFVFLHRRLEMYVCPLQECTIIIVSCKIPLL